MGGLVQATIRCLFVRLFLWGVEWQHTHRSDSDQSTRPLFPEFFCFFLRSSWATCLFRVFLSDGLPRIVRHYLRANSFFLFLWAWRGDIAASVAEFVGQGKHWRTFGVLFFLSLWFVQFRIFLFDDLLGTVKLQSSALIVCGFLWVLSAHLRCDSHHSRQRTVFVSV